MTAVTSFSNWYRRTDPVTVTVTFEERPHWLGDDAEHRGRKMKAYAVVHNGVEVGTVEHVVESTDTQIAGTRLRRAGRGRLAWAWRARSGEANAPGLYCTARWEAASRILTALRQGEAVR